MLFKQCFKANEAGSSGEWERRDQKVWVRDKIG